MSASLPPARVIRQAGGPVAPPRIPLRVRLERARPVARRVVAPLKLGVLYAIAFWPLTAVVLFASAMILVASNAAGP